MPALEASLQRVFLSQSNYPGNPNPLSERPTRRLVKWFRSTFQREGPNQGEKVTPKKFSELVTFIYSAESQIDAVVLGDVATYLVSSGLMSPEHIEDSKKVISLVCDAQHRRKIFDVLRIGIGNPGERFKNRARSLAQLENLTEDFSNSKEAARIAHMLTLDGESCPPTRSVEGKKILRKSYEYTHEKTGYRDDVSFLFPEDVPQDKCEAAILQFQAVWRSLRLYQSDKKCTVLFVHAPNPLKKVRSCATMNEQPAMVVELSDDDYLGITAHETIHAVFGAESGHPHSNDFAEGCAMRLGKLFVPGSRTNTPSEHVASLLNQYRRTGEIARSNTGMLERAKQSGRQFAHWENDTAKYVYGYFLIDSVLQHSKFKILQDRAAKTTGRYWSFLHTINDAYNKVATEIYSQSDRKKQLLNRELIIASFVQAGFEEHEVKQIIFEAEKLIGQFANDLSASA